MVKHYKRTIWDSLEMLDGGSNILTAQDIYFAPLEVEYTITVEAIGFSVTTANGGSVKVAIYEDNGDTPAGGALIVGSGGVALAGNNRKQEIAITSTQLTPGLYWLSLLSLAGAQGTLRCHPWPTASTGGTLQSKQSANGSDNLPDPAPGVGNDNLAPIMYVLVESVP